MPTELENSLARAVDRLRKEVARLKKDEKRLDWLEKKPQRIYRDIPARWVISGQTVATIGDIGGTLRQAIDAARKRDNITDGERRG